MLEQELVEVHTIWVLLLAILVSAVASSLIVVLQKSS